MGVPPEVVMLRYVFAALCLSACSAEPTPPLPQAPSVRCGPGTVEQDGVCVVEDEVPDCGAGTTLRGAMCVDLEVPAVALPFPAGVAVTVSQGHHGAFSHAGSSSYAVDFPVPVGTPIVAARAGRVLDLREDSDTGCGEPSCGSEANYLTIDHGDGTFGQYWHLALDGVLVDVGDVVAQGQLVALSGNTGFSTGPHLHFQVRDPLGTTLPLVFVDQPDGVVFAGGYFVSGNTEQPAPEALEWSTCPTDLFAFLGVELEPGVPCARVEPDGVDPVAGRVLGEQGNALVATISSATGEYDLACADGPRFETEIDWPALGYAEDALLVVGAASAECRAFQVPAVAVWLELGG